MATRVKFTKQDKVILASMSKDDRALFKRMTLEGRKFAEESKSRRKTTLETDSDASANNASELV